MQLVPAIDLRGGQCVRLLQGRFDAETVYGDDPGVILGRYRDLGARYVHVVDLDGARDGSQGNRARQSPGWRGRSQTPPSRSAAASARVRSWPNCSLGVQRIVIGSVAVTKPAEVRQWLEEFGPDRIVLAFDVRLDAGGTPRLTTHGWESQTEASLWDAVLTYQPHGAMHVLCTDVARDGALSGPNLALYTEALRRFPKIQWQASGGVSCGADLVALAATGAAAVISGRALLENRIPAAELAPFLPNA